MTIIIMETFMGHDCDAPTEEALMEDGVRFIRNGCSLTDSIVTEQQLIERG
jgi:hypothetical protein